MGNGNLPANATAENVVSVVNDLLAALKGGLFPRNVQGAVVSGDGTTAPDIGSPTTPFDAAYIKSIVAGGVDIDLEALAASGIIVINASNPTYRWEQGATEALFIVFSGQSGAGSGGLGGYIPAFQNVNLLVIPHNGARSGSQGQSGGETTITHTRTNKQINSGKSSGGLGGYNIIHYFDSSILPDETNQFNAINVDTPNELTIYAGDNSNKTGGRGGVLGRPEALTENAILYSNSLLRTAVSGTNLAIAGGTGGAGGALVSSSIITDIRDGDNFNIQIGSGGLGGAAGNIDPTPTRSGNPAKRAGAAGGDGQSGYVLIIPIQT